MWPAFRLVIKTELDKHVLASPPTTSKGLFNDRVALAAVAGGERKKWRDLSEGEREAARKANGDKDCTAWKRYGSCRFGDSCMFKHDAQSKGKEKKKVSANVAVNEAKGDKKKKKVKEIEGNNEEEEESEEEELKNLSQPSPLRPAIKKQKV